MSKKKVAKDKPVYERNRVMKSVISNEFFFCPKVRVLGDSIFLVAGKKVNITEDLQPFLLKKYRK